MKFTVDITKEEFKKFNYYVMAKINQSKAIKWKLQAFYLIFGGLLTVFLFEMYLVYKNECCFSYSNLNSAMIALGVWFVILNLWQQIYIRLFISAGVDEQGSVLGLWEIEITEYGISESNSLFSSTFAWEGIKSVEKDKHSLYLFSDAVKAIILPLEQISEEIESEITKNITNRSK